MRTHRSYSVYMIRSISVRELREKLADVLDDVARGRQIVITRRGKAVARMIPPSPDTTLSDSRYPLRGSVRAVSEDFDEPMEGIWESLEE